MGRQRQHRQTLPPPRRNRNTALRGHRLPDAGGRHRYRARAGYDGAEEDRFRSIVVILYRSGLCTLCIFETMPAQPYLGLHLYSHNNLLM